MPDSSVMTHDSRSDTLHDSAGVCAAGMYGEKFDGYEVDVEKNGSRDQENVVGIGIDIENNTPGNDDAKFNRVVWRKVDWAILPVVAMFYLLSFLDRTNLGNARVAGLQTDLGMTNTQYSIALTVTYIPYILAELPSNLLLNVIGPDKMLPTMLTFWGVATTCQGVVRSYKALLVCRFFLGLLEGGVLPGLVLYLSMFYPRHRLQTRISAFFSTASLASAFSGLLAYGILLIPFPHSTAFSPSHQNSLRGANAATPRWTYIFLLEGAFTILFGLASFRLLPRSPADLAPSTLTVSQRNWLVRVLQENSGASATPTSVDCDVKSDEQQDSTAEKFSWAEVRKAFMLPQVWMLAVAFFFGGTILYGLAYFTPSIVQSLVPPHTSPATVQLLSVPPFALAFVVTMGAALLSEGHSKKTRRGVTCIVCAVFCTIGFGMFLASQNKHVQYASLFFSIPGVYCSAPTLSTWSANNAAPHTRRATAVAIGFIMTNSGGILATWLLGSISPAAPYRTATIVLLVFSVGMGLVCGINLAYLDRRNRAKAAARTGFEPGEKHEQRALGDESILFEYSL